MTSPGHLESGTSDSEVRNYEQNPNDDVYAEKREEAASDSKTLEDRETSSVQPGDQGCAIPEFSKYETSVVHRLLTPRNCRWDPESPAPLSTALCILYAFASTFTVANLYYNQPILNKMASEFNVSYETSAQVPTLMQAGYATGLVFVLPLGDILERRMFIILVVFFTATLWIVLCMTDDFAVFRAISYICGVTTVTPQLMIPLVGDFARPERRAASLSIVVSGLSLGILIARVLSGIVSNYTSWRNIYWLACGAQYVLAGLLFLFMPDYPSTNPDGLNYFRALWSIPYMVVTQPLLIQSCLIGFCLACVFTSFWTTVTFLLVSDPFDFSSLQIGLFSLVTIFAIIVTPVVGHFIDKFVPLFSILIGQTFAMMGTVVGFSVSNVSLAGPILQAMGSDAGIQTAQIANRSAIFNINPKARNRVNTAYMAAVFAGQLTGTAVGNRLYAAGGWRWSTGCSIGLIGASILIALSRGPRETGWVGWGGGWRPRRDPPPCSNQQESE